MSQKLPQAYNGCTCRCHTDPGVMHIKPCCRPSPMFSNPTRYNVGDKVVITDACIKRMVDSNHSCVTPQYPSDSFIDKAKQCVGVIGEVTHTFPPGYEVAARFGDQGFHMKDNWIEKANG